MGGSSSSEPQPPPPESPTFRESWRKISWGDNAKDLQYVQEYKPENNIKHLRILLYGPVGAGKSSFISSVDSVMQGRITTPALASAMTSDRSFTKKYETHKIRQGKGNPKTFYPFVFNDIMGLEVGTDCGVRAEDIKLAMKGHVKDGYKFNPVSTLTDSDPGYNSTSSPDDKVHVLVCVLSANSAEITKSVLDKMTDIREAASDMGIPQMAIITNIDGAFEEIETDLKNVYKSKQLKKKMADFSSIVGIPMNCIYPLKNYCEEIDTDDDVDTLILSAMKCIINFGNDFIEKM